MYIHKAVYKKANNYQRIVLLICIFAFAIIWTGCNRKVGVKPGGKLKISTAKCKCKKREGGIYSVVSNQKASSFYYNLPIEKVLKA
jgi:hypothetical protein